MTNIFQTVIVMNFFRGINYCVLIFLKLKKYTCDTFLHENLKNSFIRNVNPL